MRLHQLSIFLCALITHFHQPVNWLQLLLLYERSQDKELWSNHFLQGTQVFTKEHKFTCEVMLFTFTLCQGDPVRYLWEPSCDAWPGREHEWNTINDVQGNCVQMFSATKAMMKTKCDLIQMMFNRAALISPVLSLEPNKRLPANRRLLYSSCGDGAGFVTVRVLCQSWCLFNKQLWELWQTQTASLTALAFRLADQNTAHSLMNVTWFCSCDTLQLKAHSVTAGPKPNLITL